MGYTEVGGCFVGDGFTVCVGLQLHGGIDGVGSHLFDVEPFRICSEYMVNFMSQAESEIVDSVKAHGHGYYRGVIQPVAHAIEL